MALIRWVHAMADVCKPLMMLYSMVDVALTKRVG